MPPIASTPSNPASFIAQKRATDGETKGPGGAADELMDLPPIFGGKWCEAIPLQGLRGAEPGAEARIIGNEANHPFCER